MRPVALRSRARAAACGAMTLVAVGGCRSLATGAAAGDASGVRALRRTIDSLLAQPAFAGAHWGILVVDPVRGDTLYSHNAGKLFMPASNQKLLTGAVALHHLGPEFRFSTTVFADGAVAGGVLQGNLRIVGTGDPTVSDHMQRDAMRVMRQFADSVASRGIRAIAGQLVAGGDAFPGATLGYGWSWDDLDFPYSAGVDELYFNEGFVRIVARPSRVGGPADLTTAPTRTFPTVQNLTRTIAAADSGRRSRLRVRHDSLDARTIIVEGEVAVGDSASATITFRDHRRAFLEALREALAERGILVSDGVEPFATAAAMPAGRREPAGIALFSVVSPPLREILPAFEKPSQNQIGEVLLRALGRARTGIGSPDSGARVVQRQLVEWGARPNGAVVRDGSGLSRHNVVSPETLVTLLEAMRRHEHFPVFYDALPIGGVDGTIRGRMRGTAAEGNVHAKTGTLDMVRALSGYVTTASGRVLLFSTLANHWTTPVREVDMVQDSIAARLARLGGGRR